MGRKNIIVQASNVIDTKFREVISSIPPYTSTIDLTDTTEYDADTWYPVVCDPGIPSDGRLYRLNIYTTLGKSGKPYWAAHQNGFSCNLDILNSGSGSGTTPGHVIVINKMSKFVGSGFPVGYKQIDTNSAVVFSCRGGGRYYIDTNFKTNWSIYKTEVEVADGIKVSPTTTEPDIYSYPRSTITADIQCGTAKFYLNNIRNGDVMIGTNYVRVGTNYIKSDGIHREDSSTRVSNILLKGYNDCREISISEQFDSVSSTVGLIAGTTNNSVPYFAAWGTSTNLGNPGRLWKQVYAATTAISTSDRTKKKDISYIGDKTEFDTELSDDALVEFIMALKPCIYRFIENDSNRPHHGMISQDIEDIINKGILPDHAGFIKSPKVVLKPDVDEDGNEILDENGKVHYHDEIIEGEYDYGLRNEEFIADIIRFCQILKNENTLLKEKNQILENKLEIMEEKINSILKQLS